MTAWRRDELRRAPHGNTSLLEAALDAIGRAAIVVDAAGSILHANSIARALIAGGKTSVHDALLRVVRGEEHADWSRTRVVTNGYDLLDLFVARPRNLGLAERFAKAGREWRLTRRQVDVLEKISYGNSNKVVAAALGISCRTVEVHVTAIFAKARVTSRMELLVKLLALE